MATFVKKQNTKKVNFASKPTYRKAKPTTTQKPVAQKPIPLVLTGTYSFNNSFTTKTTALCSELVLSCKKQCLERKPNYQNAREYYESILYNGDEYAYGFENIEDSVPDRTNGNYFHVVFIDPLEIKNNMQRFIDVIYDDIMADSCTNFSTVVRAALREIDARFCYAPLKEFLLLQYQIKKKKNPDYKERFGIIQIIDKMKDTLASELAGINMEITNHNSKGRQINPNHIKVPTRSILFQYSFAIQDMIKVFEKGPSI